MRMPKALYYITYWLLSFEENGKSTQAERNVGFGTNGHVSRQV